MLVFGSVLRVPKAKLKALAGGRIDEVEPVPVVEFDAHRAETPAVPKPARRPRTSTRSSAQPALPFTATDAS